MFLYLQYNPKFHPFSINTWASCKSWLRRARCNADSPSLVVKSTCMRGSFSRRSKASFALPEYTECKKAKFLSFNIRSWTTWLRSAIVWLSIASATIVSRPTPLKIITARPQPATIRDDGVFFRQHFIFCRGLMLVVNIIVVDNDVVILLLYY